MTISTVHNIHLDSDEDRPSSAHVRVEVLDGGSVVVEIGQYPTQLRLFVRDVETGDQLARAFHHAQTQLVRVDEELPTGPAAVFTRRLREAIA